MNKHNNFLLAMAGVGLALTLVGGTQAQMQQIDPNKAKQMQTGPQYQGPTPQLQLKPDLTILSMGMSQEFCLEGCGDVWTRELQVNRLPAERCYWQVQVKNIGAGPSVAGKVKVEYQSLNGPITLMADMPALRAGQAHMVVVPFNNARPRNLYWLFNTPFVGTADSTNTNAESNETNNTANVRMTPTA